MVEALEETRTQLLLVSEPIFASAADLLARFQTLPPAAAQARENTKLSELEIKAGLLQVSGLLLQMLCWDVGSGDIVPKLRPHPADMLLHELKPVTGLGQVAAHLPGTPAHAQCSSWQRARGALLRRSPHQEVTMQVADGLHFLHTEANQVHRALCPHTILITSMGAWKLGGLSLACPSFITPDTAGVVPISYRDPTMERFMRWQQVCPCWSAPAISQNRLSCRQYSWVLASSMR